MVVDDGAVDGLVVLREAAGRGKPEHQGNGQQQFPDFHLSFPLLLYDWNSAP
jgi:hypothetical protein